MTIGLMLLLVLPLYWETNRQLDIQSDIEDTALALACASDRADAVRLLLDESHHMHEGN